MKGRANVSQEEKKIGRILLFVKHFELVVLLEPQLLRAITMLKLKDYSLIINIMVSKLDMRHLDLFKKKDFNKLCDSDTFKEEWTGYLDC